MDAHRREPMQAVLGVPPDTYRDRVAAAKRHATEVGRRVP